MRRSATPCPANLRPGHQGIALIWSAAVSTARRRHHRHAARTPCARGHAQLRLVLLRRDVRVHPRLDDSHRNNGNVSHRPPRGCGQGQGRAQASDLIGRAEMQRHSPGRLASDRCRKPVLRLKLAAVFFQTQISYDKQRAPCVQGAHNSFRHINRHSLDVTARVFIADESTRTEL